MSQNHVAQEMSQDRNGAQRLHLLMQLRLVKTPFEDAWKQCGYPSEGACRKAYQREMKRAKEEQREQDVHNVRYEEVLILNKLHETWWKTATDNTKPGNLFAVDRILAIAERRAKLLNLDVHPEELAENQNYTKQIILTHESGGQDARPHD